MNPAIAIALMLAGPMGEHVSAKEAFYHVWLYPIFPIVGTCLALVFYECVYKPAETLIAHEAERDDSEEEEETL